MTTAPAAAPTDPMIRLERLTKTFPGQARPAVEALDMDIAAGEIVVLVGPSGCGKTTTMRLINRLIEPTSGRIFLEGDEVTKVNPDQLRRRIGYVIQQVGLFPHQTIADNIATVPRMLGWDEQRIRARVDELLALVGLEPATYRGRYPKHLSGGQRQRAGVARALSADPPVMLMDEPFGAIDPITRDRLQNEFLRLQETIRKTIIFVTHDIDEAIKMGDRLAILREGSKIAQYDTPERILSAPADDFVADFIGAGASLKRLNLSRVRDVELSDWPVASVDSSRAEVLAALRASDKGAVLLLDAERRPARWVSGRELQREDGPLSEMGLPPEALVQPNATLSDALNEMLKSRYGCATVIDGAGVYQGNLDFATVSAAIQEMRRDARDRSRAEADEVHAAGEAGA
ncbi:MAG: betaine/proline/choline family ABC transporter ATP-binding protein [Acidimicrobiia bacterium]|nr:betaine/proline/choline family ABC transporter ATP-binding protein [Acidimicrobiia bacterium]